MLYAEDYRAKAADCLRRAGEAGDDYHRKNFEQLAAMWSEMAAKAENRAVAGEAAEREALSDALSTIQNANVR